MPKRISPPKRVAWIGALAGFCLATGSVQAQSIGYVATFGQLGPLPGEFSQPTAVAVDGEGRIFVAERQNHRFQICDYEGNCEAVGGFGTGPGRFWDPQGIAIDGDGRVVIGDNENNRVQILDQQGNVISMFGTPGDGVGQFSSVNGVAVDNQGQVIIAEANNARIQICSYQGACSSFGSNDTTVGHFDFPRDVAVDHEGRIVVADWMNNRIQVCDYQGNCYEFGGYGVVPGKFKSPAGVAIDNMGRIVVADRDNNRIQLCDHSGACIAYGRSGTGPGEFHRPVGIDVDQDNRIIVGERDNHRIQILQIYEEGEGPFTINAGLNDAWYNPETSGQGFFLTVFEDLQTMFLAWFTYDTERPDENVQAYLGEPGHRWLTAYGPYQGNLAQLDVELTSGGVFNAAEPAPGQAQDGTISIQFDNCNAATVSYDIWSAGVAGQVPIERIALDNLPICESAQQN